MKRHIFLTFALIFSICVGINAQVPLNTLVQITKAEDARAFDGVLEGLMRSPNAETRNRAALAAGRIGDERALPALIGLLEEDPEAAGMAAFAIGEIESIKGAGAIMKNLDSVVNGDGRSVLDLGLATSLIEAAGKIAAANPKEDDSKKLGKLILNSLGRSKMDAANRMPRGDRDFFVSGLTAVLRARPEGADVVVARFLSSPHARIRSDAGNTLTRLRAKNANETLRQMLVSEPDGAARSNAARALGAAEDKDSVELLVKAATTDADLRVRVSAVRSLAALKDAKAADKLIERGNQLLIPIHGDPAPLKPGERRILKPIEVPLPKNELLEIATTVGRLLANTGNTEAARFLMKLMSEDSFRSAEPMVAYARIGPKNFLNMTVPAGAYSDFRVASAYGQGLAEFANLKDDALNAQAGKKLTDFIAGMATGVKPKDEARMMLAMADLTGSLAALKPDNLDEILRGQLKNDDVFIRAAAAGAIAERPASKENLDALKSAFIKASMIDKHDNDALIATLDAIEKLDKKAGVGTFLMALNDQDYLIRKKAFGILDDKDLQKEFPGIPASLAAAREKKREQALPYSPVSGTRLGQILNTDADYRRALSRKNGSVRAVLTTEKGAFTIVFNPEEAPLTVDNWVKLARSGYFNGLEVHRVVPNFVMQDGDPRGDGNGGPGWSIRCEVNMLGYDRGAVGMALSGKDTGGSQWFVTHSPQPHLDGGYTVFGHVDEAGMKVVDNIVRGDKILTVKIIGK